jgi:hypothetical protein
MAELKITFHGMRGRRGALLVMAAGLACIVSMVALSALPAVLFGTKLTDSEAEESIRRYLLSQAITAFYRRTPRDAADLQSRYSVEVLQPLEKIEVLSIDVDTVIFSAFSIRRSFVAKAVVRGEAQSPATRYFCFMGTYLTGECARWNWFLAW